MSHHDLGSCTKHQRLEGMHSHVEGCFQKLMETIMNKNCAPAHKQNKNCANQQKEQIHFECASLKYPVHSMRAWNRLISVRSLIQESVGCMRQGYVEELWPKDVSLQVTFELSASGSYCK